VPPAGEVFLAVHAEKLLIGGAPGPGDEVCNRLTGRVTEIVYQGESLKVFLALEGGPILSLRQPGHHAARLRVPPVGESVTVTLHPEDTIVVPASSA
jgi:putative spermidine/putrescine transport system ATP-binding protein